MTLTNKQLAWIGIGVVCVIIIYANRGNLPLPKEPLNADGEGVNALDKAIAKLKSGQIKVIEMPENVKKQLNEV
jgi:hypothetical protein